MKRDLHSQRFIILDTESTGNDTKTDKPIEIAAVEWQGGSSGLLKTWHVDPKMPIKPSASAVHHLTKADIQGQPSLEDIKDDLISFIGESPLVIHNKAFDHAMLPFLENHPTFCSLRLARKTWSRGEQNYEGFPLKNHTAQVLRYWLGLRVDTLGLAAHRAAADILVTGHIFQAQMDAYLDHGHPNDLESFLNFERSPIEYPKFPFGSHENVAFEDLPDQFIRFYLDPTKTTNPDPDVLRLMQKEQARRLQEVAFIRDHLPRQSFMKI